MWGQPIQRIVSSCIGLNQPLLRPFHARIKRQWLWTVSFQQIGCGKNAHSASLCNLLGRIWQVVHVERCSDAAEERFESAKFGAGHHGLMIKHSNFCGHEAREEIFQVHVVAKPAEQCHAEVGMGINQSGHHDCTACVNNFVRSMADGAVGNLADQSVFIHNDRAAIDDGALFINRNYARIDDGKHVVTHETISPFRWSKAIKIRLNRSPTFLDESLPT